MIEASRLFVLICVWPRSSDYSAVLLLLLGGWGMGGRSGEQLFQVKMEQHRWGVGGSICVWELYVDQDQRIDVLIETQQKTQLWNTFSLIIGNCIKGAVNMCHVPHFYTVKCGKNNLKKYLSK